MANPKGNPKNLMKKGDQSPAEARKNGKKGGIKSGKVRRRKADIQAAIKKFFEATMTIKEKNELIDQMAEKGKISTEEFIVLKQGLKAIKGDSKAFEILADRFYGRPKQANVNLNIEGDKEDSAKVREFFETGFK